MATGNYIRLKLKTEEKEGTLKKSSSPFLATGVDKAASWVNKGPRAPEEPTLGLILRCGHLGILNNCQTRGLHVHCPGPH